MLVNFVAVSVNMLKLLLMMSLFGTKDIKNTTRMGLLTSLNILV